MKILVLGNGFDLDHNLPTGYKDFLHFCLYIVNSQESSKMYYEKLNTTQKKYVKKLEQKSSIKKQFLDLLKNNHLLSYFNFCLEQQGNNWIDLEREIKNIVYKFELIEEEYLSSKMIWYPTNGDHRSHQLINKLGLNEIVREGINEISLNNIHSVLQKSLMNFCKALEIYIVDFINKTPINGVAPDIIDFDATDIITFNYSNTYQRVYGGVHWKENIEHIHGIADNKNFDETNIVLGITTNSHERATNRYVDFQKYFQRITKKTENTYKNWLLIKSSNNKNIEVVFFGHSLDSSDSDIIKDLICHEKTRITIYYFNDTAHKNIVANLIEILDKEKVIEYTTGENPKIVFKRQRPHQHNNTAGVEIERDIRKLYKLYSTKSKDINKLLNKIFKNADRRKLSYFYSQRKTIDLFEALKYLAIDGINTKTFLDICTSLNFELSTGGSLVKYVNDEWYGETAWGDILECSEETKELIDLVNKSNEILFNKKKSQKPYSYFHNFSSAEQIKLELLKIFQKDPSETYWKDLNHLINDMIENDIFRKAVDLLERENHKISISSKIKHFCEVYRETNYYYQEQKQLEEAQKNNYDSNDQ